MVLPVLMSSRDLGDGVLDEGVADQAVLAELEGFEDGDAGAVKDGQVVREAGQGQHQVQRAKDRQAQLQAITARATRAGRRRRTGRPMTKKTSSGSQATRLPDKIARRQHDARSATAAGR